MGAKQRQIDRSYESLDETKVGNGNSRFVRARTAFKSRKISAILVIIRYTGALRDHDGKSAGRLRIGQS